jgi:Leucine-rich repeat (LRR) protein
MFLIDLLLKLINRIKYLNVCNKSIDEAVKLINDNKETLIDLECSYSQITSLPNMPKLKALNCRNTIIINLPDIPNLIELYCSISQITSLPDMPNLEILDCSNTQITNLPNMPNLKELYCYGTNITSLPNMPNLRYLCCSNTQIKSLPDMPNLINLICNIISLEDYKKICKTRKTLIILASLQVIKGKKLSNIHGFNIARLVGEYF